MLRIRIKRRINRKSIPSPPTDKPKEKAAKRSFQPHDEGIPRTDDGWRGRVGFDGELSFDDDIHEEGMQSIRRPRSGYRPSLKQGEQQRLGLQVAGSHLGLSLQPLGILCFLQPPDHGDKRQTAFGIVVAQSNLQFARKCSLLLQQELQRSQARGMDG